jgi:hypothetical protein
MTDTIVMTVDELVMRFESGNRFRLVRLLYTRPATTPTKVAGQWPLIVEACWAVDPGPREALVIADGMGDSGYGARPGDEVAVIPVHPAQAARSLEVAVGAAI